MNLSAAALCLVLGQEPPPADAPPPAAEPTAPAPAEGGAEGGAAPTVPPIGQPFIPAAPVGPPKPNGADEVSKIIAKLPSMTEEEKAKALELIAKKYGPADTNPVLPTADVALDKYLGLKPQEQAEVVARGFLLDLIAGDSSRLVARAGFPFHFESRNLNQPEQLRTEWSRSVRSRRTDLLKLYSIEILTPAEMEKKYGKPPARLSGWNLRAPNTFVAVGNLSGHATIVLLRQAGAAWQVVGFTD